MGGRGSAVPTGFHLKTWSQGEILVIGIVSAEQSSSQPIALWSSTHDYKGEMCCRLHLNNSWEHGFLLGNGCYISTTLC